MMRWILIGLLCGTSMVVAQGGWGDRGLSVHDPSTVVEEKKDAYALATGMGVDILKRKSDGEWARAGSVFQRGKEPAWHKEMVPENRGHLWAPDVIKVGEKWFVYYSISSFGKNTSAIGLASSESLDPESKKFKWKDEGMVIRSQPKDHFNAIDPAVMQDGKRLWMTFGSFWNGIMMVELDPKTGLMKNPKSKPTQLAMKREIEAPFLCKEGDWYYLFVNWGKCCRGVDSTYEIRVGRSKDIEGPYKDKEGVALTAGGGTLVLKTEDEFIGPGHASIFEEKKKEWLVHHYYDGKQRGRSKLRMVPFEWKDGWPVVETKETK